MGWGLYPVNPRRRELNCGDQSGSLVAHVLKVGGDLPGSSVVSGDSVDPALFEGESELAVHVLFVLVEVLPHGDGLELAGFSGVITFLIK